jgi:hypothetical protein
MHYHVWRSCGINLLIAGKYQGQYVKFVFNLKPFHFTINILSHPKSHLQLKQFDHLNHDFYPNLI